MDEPKSDSAFVRFWLTDPQVLAWRRELMGRDLHPQEALGMLTDPQNKYDYRRAWESGDRPTKSPLDGKYHWGSSGKMPGHPTMWKQRVYSSTGVNPDDVLRAIAILLARPK